MITEDYVSFETAKLLKEKGFNEDSWSHYDADGDIVRRGYRLNMPEDIPAWTLQMVMKWLRVKYSLEIYPYHDSSKPPFKWWFEIIKYPNTVAEYESGKDEEFDTYEEACEAAIKYCLENLI